MQLKQEEQDEASAIQELHSAGRVQVQLTCWDGAPRRGGESEAESVLSDTSEEYDTRCTSPRPEFAESMDYLAKRHSEIWMAKRL